MQHYDVIERIGEGTYGVVLKCLHQLTGEVVAVKQFKDLGTHAYVHRTVHRELRVHRLLRGQPHIVPLRDVFSEDGRLYLVMAYVPRNLLDVLDAQPCGLRIDQLRVCMYTLLLAVRSCHTHGVVHRDIKPENVLVHDDNTVALCDFGFARRVRRTQAVYSGNNSHTSRTSGDGAWGGEDDGDKAAASLVCKSNDTDKTDADNYDDDEERAMTNYVATRWYRSPEMLLGATHYGGEVDMWAVGALLAEAADGEPLLPGESEYEQLQLIHERIGDFDPADMDALRRCGVAWLQEPPPTTTATTATAAEEQCSHGNDTTSRALCREYLQQRYEHCLGVSGVDLLRRLLDPCGATRATVHEALAHPFFAAVCAHADGDVDGYGDNTCRYDVTSTSTAAVHDDKDKDSSSVVVVDDAAAAAATHRQLQRQLPPPLAPRSSLLAATTAATAARMTTALSPSASLCSSRLSPIAPAAAATTSPAWLPAAAASVPATAATTTTNNNNNNNPTPSRLPAQPPRLHAMHRHFAGAAVAMAALRSRQLSLPTRTTSPPPAMTTAATAAATAAPHSHPQQPPLLMTASSQTNKTASTAAVVPTATRRPVTRRTRRARQRSGVVATSSGALAWDVLLAQTYGVRSCSSSSGSGYYHCYGSVRSSSNNNNNSNVNTSRSMSNNNNNSHTVYTQPVVAATAAAASHADGKSHAATTTTATTSAREAAQRSRVLPCVRDVQRHRNSNTLVSSGGSNSSGSHRCGTHTATTTAAPLPPHSPSSPPPTSSTAQHACALLSRRRGRGAHATTVTPLHNNSSSADEAARERSTSAARDTSQRGRRTPQQPLLPPQLPASSSSHAAHARGVAVSPYAAHARAHRRRVCRAAVVDEDDVDRCDGDEVGRTPRPARDMDVVHAHGNGSTSTMTMTTTAAAWSSAPLPLTAD